VFTLDEQAVIAYAWKTNGSRREQYAAALADPAYEHFRFLRPRSPRAVQRFLRAA
jgi:hypothetical protein